MSTIPGTVTAALAKLPAPITTSVQVPEGRLGTRKTLSLMRQLASGPEGASNPNIRMIAVDVVRDVPQMSQTAEASALCSWVRGHIRFTGEMGETLQTPIATLKLRSGDCDDQCILLGALLGSLGIAYQFQVVKPAGQESNPAAAYSHVFVVATDKRTGQSYRLDPTMYDSMTAIDGAGHAVVAPEANFTAMQVGAGGGLGCSAGLGCPGVASGGCSNCSRGGGGLGDSMPGAYAPLGSLWSDIGGIAGDVGKAVSSSAGQSILTPLAQGIATRIAFGNRTAYTATSVSSAPNPYSSEVVPNQQALLSSPQIPPWMWLAGIGLAAVLLLKR